MSNALEVKPKNEVELTPEERALLLNDLSKLNEQQRSNLYMKVCESVGLNPLTQPLSYIQLNGKLTLYAQRNCTDQLRSINNVSVTIASREKINDIYVVTARARLQNGREDESIGAVGLGKLTGDGLANAIMKAETKAKRRVTLSICGLSFLDETEVETIKDAKPFPALPATQHKEPEQPKAKAEPPPGPQQDPNFPHWEPPVDQHFDAEKFFDAMPENLSEYKIKFGPLTGKRLYEIEHTPLKDYVKRLEASNPRREEVIEFLTLAKEYLNLFSHES